MVGGCLIFGTGPPGCAVLCQACTLVQRVFVLYFAGLCEGGLSVSYQPGPVVSLECLPCGWKFSPTLRQFALHDIVTSRIPPEIKILHYLDDVLLVSSNLDLLRLATNRVVTTLRNSVFVVSDNSTLDSATTIFFCQPSSLWFVCLW